MLYSSDNYPLPSGPECPSWCRAASPRTLNDFISPGRQRVKIQPLTSVIAEVEFHAPTLVMQIMVPLAPGAEEIARVIGKRVASVVYHVFDRPANGRYDALAGG